MCLEKLPSSQINLYCLSAEISKQQSYRSILHVYTLSTDCFLDNNNRSRTVSTTSQAPGKAVHCGPYLHNHS